ncbi:MAG TPA: Ppx/GppA phosphatase family protein [Candidatus Angelobacter sp.]|jgi:exopolyphosphatase/guanosine-5'-triphosphate,3'-diphosphate pyrophosphatase|nr:Ppx/GppA phosphatase family protein [Candidatus Angelobacter sp.]
MPVFAAVDIGSNSVRLSIAGLRRGKLISLHQDREVTRLGEGVFRNGNLDPQAMARTLKVLRRFHRAVQSWAVERVRVVATSALRDSNNSQVFKEWVKSATGWQVDIISGTEEGRLIHLGVISKLRVPPPELLLIDLGGGSCELTLSRRGHINDVVTLPLGAVRLTQEFIRRDPPSSEELKRLHEFIAEEMAHIPRTIRQARIRVAIATSGTADALAGAAQSLKLARNWVTVAAAVGLAKRLAKMTQKQRATIKGINAKRSEIIVAGASVYAHILSFCGMKGFRYSPLGLRDGVLAQMAAEHDQGSRSHRQLESDRQDVLLNIVQRYGVDMKNAEHVRNLALSLFDQSRALHQLEKGFREWIAAAAMLYEVGNYINPVGRHRHTYYTIAHSELFGFTPLQRQVIAIIARFQGSSRPQLRDRLIKVLPAPMRADVIKAIALLRVARTLNQGRREAVRSIRVRARGGDITIAAKTGRTGADLELWAAGKEVPYFREVFGRELLFKLL